jgi:methyl-accepting chemotaxis protein
MLTMTIRPAWRCRQTIPTMVGQVHHTTSPPAITINGTSKQAIGLELVNDTLAQMGEKTQQNCASVEKNAETARGLDQHAQAIEERQPVPVRRIVEIGRPNA